MWPRHAVLCRVGFRWDIKRGQLADFRLYTLIFLICPLLGYLPGGQMGWPEGEQPDYNCEGKQSYAKNGREGWICHFWTIFFHSYYFTRKINPHVGKWINLYICYNAAKSIDQLAHYSPHSLADDKQSFKFIKLAIYLKAQGLSICLWIQGTQVQFPVQEATKPMSWNYWACAPEPMSCNYWAYMLKLPKLGPIEPVLYDQKSHHK